MKRWFSIAALLVVSTLPFAAQADDVRTPAQCRANATTDDPTQVAQVGNAPGRGSVCISDGSGSNELYVGGDVSQPCGRVEVAGNVIVEGGTNGGDNPDPATYCH